MLRSKLDPNLERTEHSSYLRDNCFHLFKSEDFCDITLVSVPTNQNFLCHKVVLAAFSETWRHSLRDASDPLRIEATPEDVRTLLKYIYTGFVDFDDVSACEALDRLATNYRIHLTSTVRKKLSRLFHAQDKSSWTCLTCQRRFLEVEYILAHLKLSRHEDAQCSLCRRVFVNTVRLKAHHGSCAGIDRDSPASDLSIKLEPSPSADFRNCEWDEEWSMPAAAVILPELILKEEEEVADEEEDEEGIEDEEVIEEEEEEGLTAHEDDKGGASSVVSGNIRVPTLMITPDQPQPKSSRRPNRAHHTANGRSSHQASSERSSNALKNGKKYLCSLCGHTLTGLTAYNRHQMTHSGSRPFPCDICGKSFTQNQRLTVHQRGHTGERPYLCSLCGKTFTESCKLKRHLGKVHKANKDGNSLIPGQPVIKAERSITHALKVESMRKMTQQSLGAVGKRPMRGVKH
eukprot:snap_masked-scaffold430_size173499-processed-gene-0.5 protein:Tk06997 transcript:snap_masked-scaffold430_size173499-processed-gene-0.5-mRNA-1 annotation:"zinc finger"